MKIISLISVAVVALVSNVSVSHADWAADMVLKSSSKDAKGKMFWRDGGMRMDLTADRGEMSFIVDRKRKKAWSAIHAQKMYIETTTDKIGAHVPECSGSDFDACFAKEKFKKTGSESVNGHPCTIYEKEDPEKKASHVKVWRPNDLKEVPFVRTLSTDSKGVTGQIDLTNIKVGKQDAALFAPPAGYKAMAMPAQFFKKPGSAGAGGAPQGMSSDEMTKMRDEMMKKFGGMKPPGK